MTLGGLISRLKELDPDMEMDGICRSHSYRGYYGDLAFESGERKTVWKTLAYIEECVGRQYCGWKGGNFYMDEDTPIWIANEGSTGVCIISINNDGSIVTAKEDTFF
jgi:hypothetical protein